MLARAVSATPWGIEARAIQVEVDVRHGLPQTRIVGLPDTAVRESKERVRAAVRNCGFDLPPRAVVVSLAPADVRKEGNQLDLAIALALLAAHGRIPQEGLENRLLCGELGLDGSVRGIRGGLAIADLGSRLPIGEVVVPAPNAREAAALETVPVVGPASLAEAVEHLLGIRELPRARTSERGAAAVAGRPDLSEVRGQQAAKRALEVAAAGGHNLLFVGPPGAGKTMLARRLAGLLPPLARPESIAVTKIRSLVAECPPDGLVTERPFRAPHPGISTAGMVGGGPIPRPGEVSLAHAGVLFLDELPEFRRDTLEALRQPLEEGQVSVVRARAGLRFPARFALLAAMNPCPCGHLGDPRHECRCTESQVERYRSRISGPLLDRIDLHVEVPGVSLEELRSPPGESSAAVTERVAAARARQLRRFGIRPSQPVNSTMSPEELERHAPLEPAARTLLDSAFERLGLSARALSRLLKVSRTIADLADRERITRADVAEAIQYRVLDRRLVS